MNDIAPRLSELAAPTVLDKVRPPVPASIVRVFPAPVIAPAKLTFEALVNTVFAVRATLPPPVCAIPPGAVTVPLPTVHTPELVTLRSLVEAKVTVDPRSTLDPVIDKFPTATSTPRPDNEIDPVPAFIVRAPVPLIAVANVIRVFVVKSVASPDRVTVLVPF